MNCFIRLDCGNIGIKCPISCREDSSREQPSERAVIVKNPDVRLCDEPTGALDYHTSKEILQLVEDVNKKYGNTILIVTHNDAIKYMADQVITLETDRSGKTI